MRKAQVASRTPIRAVSPRTDVRGSPPIPPRLQASTPSRSGSSCSRRKTQDARLLQVGGSPGNYAPLRLRKSRLPRG